MRDGGVFHHYSISTWHHHHLLVEELMFVNCHFSPQRELEFDHHQLLNWVHRLISAASAHTDRRLSLDSLCAMAFHAAFRLGHANRHHIPAAFQPRPVFLTQPLCEEPCSCPENRIKFQWQKNQLIFIITI